MLEGLLAADLVEAPAHVLGEGVEAAAEFAVGAAEPDEERREQRQREPARAGVHHGRQAGLRPTADPQSQSASRKTNSEATREDYRRLVGSFAATFAALRTATVPAAADRVVPLSGAQIIRCLQALAERAGIAGASSHSGCRGTASELVRRAGPRPPPSSWPGAGETPRMVARYASAITIEHGAVAQHFGGGGG